MKPREAGKWIKTSLRRKLGKLKLLHRQIGGKINQSSPAHPKIKEHFVQPPPAAVWVSFVAKDPEDPPGYCGVSPKKAYREKHREQIAFQTLAKVEFIEIEII